MRGSKCFPNKCRFPGSWESETIPGWSDPGHKTLEECKNFCKTKKDCKTCVGSLDKNMWWWPTRVEGKEIINRTNERPCVLVPLPGQHQDKCDPGVHFFEKCDDLPQPKNNKPWLGFYKANLFPDTFGIGNILGETNGFYKVDLLFWKDITYYEKIFKFLVSRNIKLILTVGSGETDRGWIGGSASNIFKLKKLLDEKYKGLLIGIYLLDEPLGWLEYFIKNEWPKWNSSTQQIYPASEYYDHNKYIQKYNSMAPDTNGNDVISEGDMYALYRTDIQLISDTFGTCVYYFTCFAWPWQKGYEKIRFSRDAPRPETPIPKGGGWKMSELSWAQFLYDNPMINVVGLDLYSSYRETNQSQANAIAKAYDFFRKIQLPGTKNMLILQSSGKLIGKECGPRNTCNLDQEKFTRDYNKMLMNYAQNNGGIEQFPFYFVFMAPTDCKNNIKPDETICDHGGKVDGWFKDSGYHCDLGKVSTYSKKCPSGIENCDCFTYPLEDGDHLFYRQRNCGSKDCFLNSTNIKMLVDSLRI
jgi:hypothetical protein